MENLENEIWKPIKGYEEYYEISNMGRVKSLGRKIITSDGRHYVRRPKIMTPVHQKTHRYLMIQLKVNKKYKGFLVHRLVAKAFVPNQYNKPEVNHKDGNVRNNNHDNLEWCTRSENEIHAYKTGIKTHEGENNSNAKLSRNDVICILKLISENHKIVDIAKRYGVNPVTIGDIKNGKRWRKLTLKSA